MVPTVQPETIEQYAVRAFEKWKLGRKYVDDGVLLVMAVVSGLILWRVISSLAVSSMAAVVAFVVSLLAGARATFGSGYGGLGGGGS